ncbi:ly6/PLAUR domain-containing protein 1-like isoform X1 [Chiloscyllium punctatum]|uniref:ly6/PLAUR domain-containing protein 1-like isoform X1 n=1 Tax=Chiloscyllium punctatum TaxID=137246 RepID=UPI003B6326EC
MEKKDECKRFQAYRLLQNSAIFNWIYNWLNAPEKKRTAATTFTGHSIKLTRNCLGRKKTGLGFQIQCYQCEEFRLNDDCSSPEFIANCTVNVQDMCLKEVIVKSDGVMYRKSCAASTSCLITSAGYQSFCSPGKVGSVCISCCNTPLCNGPRPRRRGSSAMSSRASLKLLAAVGILTSAILPT